MIKKFKGSIMLLMTSLIWGTAFVAQSEGMNYVGPFTYNAMRTLLGGIVLIPVIMLFRFLDRKSGGGKSEYSLKNTVAGGICCGAVLFIASSLQQAGIVYTTAGKAGFVTALYIVIVPVIGIFLHRKMPLKMWLFIAVALAGFWLLCIKDNFSISSGDMLVFIGAVFFAVHIIVIDHFNKMETDGVLMSCIQFFTAGLLMLICMFIFEKPVISDICDAGGTILYAGIMSCGAAYTLQILGQKYTNPTLATLLMSLESVFAALSGWLILNERLSAKEFFGCVLIFAAVILAQLAGTDKQQTEMNGELK
ncbi:DMT family transporter [Huintestinicola sp.]